MTKGIFLVLFLVTMLFSVAPCFGSSPEAQENLSGQTKPTYKLTVGEGYTLCEAYLRNLEAFGPEERDPVCDPRPHSSLKDFSEPEWEEMDIWGNIELIYKAEMSLGIYRGHPERQPPYEQWRQEFESKVHSGEIHPKLKHTQIEFFQDKPETIMAYARNYPEGCEAEPESRDYDGGGFHWFYYDEEANAIKPALEIYWGGNSPGTFLLRKGHPYIIKNPAGFGSEISLYKNKSRWSTHNFEEFCRYDVNDPARPNTLIIPYWERKKEKQQ